MSNDIVDDLRQWANDREYGFTYLIEAVDEIVRLRAAGDALAGMFLARLEPLDSSERAVIEQWEEARRG